MTRPTLTVGGLMAAVLLVAGGLAALRDPGPIRASLAFSLALAILSIAGLLGCVRRGRSRAGWAGMAILGLAYLHFAFAGRVTNPPPLISMAPITWAADRMASSVAPPGRTAFSGTTGPAPPGTRIIGTDSGTSHVNLITNFSTTTDGVTGITTSTYFAPRLDRFDRTAFDQTCQSLVALIVGLIGAITGRMLVDRDDSNGTLSASGEV